MDIELVILTKSSKYKGYCVAGIDIRSGQWVRLTSDDESTHGALSLRDMQYKNRSVCQTLDIVKVEVVNRNPSEYQPENVLINTGYYWQKIGKYTINDILRIHPAEKHEFLFGNLRPYTTEAEMSSIGYSLALVNAKNLIISQTTNPYGKPKTKIDFSYGAKWYKNISVTDPNYYNAPDRMQISKAVLVISLPDSPFPEDKYYKFVAQIYNI
ncbi:MAG: hypothetical protein FWF85_00980 [Clostridiales bacterium]|jgi:hypothetical protein|nr:hypothetical protein [Clostridiales bacterium]MDR2713766.1 hypothetical protein [Clostridiales bacterium]